MWGTFKIFKKISTTISNKLKQYTKDSILIAEKKYNHLFFKANTESKKFKNLKLNYNLSELENSNLISTLEDFYNFPETIILFGSFAKAEDNSNSDIDLLIISSKKEEPNLEKFEKKLGHKIQLFIHSKKELSKLKDKNKELVNNWINGIVISGYFELFYDIPRFHEKI
jgi:predicted nucleotidyltransferase